MSHHKDQLKGLYAITDENLISKQYFNQTVESALKGGAKIIQYRDKSNDQKKRLVQATALRLLCKRYEALCIINDDIELAKAIDADGVHLGKDDSSIAQARKALGDDAIIGVSCYNDITIAIEAEKNTADYVAFGAIFSSSTKPDATVAGLDIISQAKRQLSIPVCTIGGITEDNLQQVVQHGADMSAVISSLFSSSDILQSANNLSKHFN
ncbi:MAG: thiamine phosphate synthase [Gammaproteobacteria bacterium]|nr:MAG: thiamine phosphate synthase [Gammaproteobacteria bacterium]